MSAVNWPNLPVTFDIPPRIGRLKLTFECAESTDIGAAAYTATQSAATKPIANIFLNIILFILFLCNFLKSGHEY